MLCFWVTGFSRKVCRRTGNLLWSPGLPGEEAGRGRRSRGGRGRGREEAGPARLRCWPELFSHCATVLTCNEQCNVKRASAL